jgi:hypothetical protein
MNWNRSKPCSSAPLSWLGSLIAALPLCACVLGPSPTREAPAAADAPDAGAREPGAAADPAVNPGPAGDTPEPSVTYSGALDVKDMIASMSASQGEAELTVYAALLHRRAVGDPDPDFVVLDSGDRFTATIGNVTVPMVVDNQGNKVRYVASVPAPTAAVNVVISFSRANGKAGAPYSVVALAPPFQLATTPPPSFQRGAPLALKIAGATRPRSLMLDFEGVCVDDGADMVVFDGQGSATFDTSLVSPLAGSSTSCDVVGHLRAPTQGDVDSAFQRGLFGARAKVEGLQIRSFKTHVSP